MIQKTKVIAILIPFFFSLTGVALALPAGQNQLRLMTGSPKRNGETAFSYMVSWRKGGTNLHRANGLTFINGSDSKKPTSEIEAAHKITKALDGSIAYDAPQDRGALVKNSKGKSDVIVSNKNGFDLAHITTRDYSNQKLQYNIPNKSFKSASVGMSIDLVYSAAVEYMEGFSSGIKQEAAGGFVRITIDNKTPIEIQTAGKSTRQIETELVEALGSIAKFSSTSIFPNFVERKSRNYKAFDGGEVQLLALDAKTITIDVGDSGIGVLTKFQFPDVNKPTDVAGNINYIVGAFVFCVLGYFAYTARINRNNEENS